MEKVEHYLVSQGGSEVKIVFNEDDQVGPAGLNLGRRSLHPASYILPTGAESLVAFEAEK